MNENLLFLLVGVGIGTFFTFLFMLQRVTSLKKEIKKGQNLELRFGDAFKNLANDILEERQKKFKEESHEVLKPLEENLTEFKQRLENNNKEYIERNTRLLEKVSVLEKMNMEMAKETDKLTRALKGDIKKQGAWGEVVLQRILEASGLREGSEYVTQGIGVNTTNEEGTNLKPDYMIKLPEDKYIILDSKVSITAYERYINEEEDVKKDAALSDLLQSVKNHIVSLSEKRYQDLPIHTPKFVFMFLPLEGIYSAVLMKDEKIFDFAASKNIIIVTPTTLLASLWMIGYIWKGENQSKNSLLIAEKAGLLYDKLVVFIETFKQAGDQLEKAKDSYQRSFNTLINGKGNVVSKLEEIKNMGASNSKHMDKDLVGMAEDE